MADRGRCVCLYHIWTRSGATPSRPHCHAAMVLCAEMQQVCTRLKDLALAMCNKLKMVEEGGREGGGEKNKNETKEIKNEGNKPGGSLLARDNNENKPRTRKI